MWTVKKVPSFTSIFDPIFINIAVIYANHTCINRNMHEHFSKSILIPSLSLFLNIWINYYYIFQYAAWKTSSKFIFSFTQSLSYLLCWWLDWVCFYCSIQGSWVSFSFTLDRHQLWELNWVTGLTAGIRYGFPISHLMWYMSMQICKLPSFVPLNIKPIVISN